MRAILAALVFCFVASMISQAEARVHHHRHHHHRVATHHHHRSSAAAQLLGPGLVHMLKSAQQQTAAWPTGDAIGAPYGAPSGYDLQPALESVARASAKIGRAIAAGVSDVYAKVAAAAAAAGVPVDIAEAVARHESGYAVNARGAAGEVGVMQVLPRTAAAMGENPYNLDGNLRAGMKYLRLALATSSDLCAAISAYNHGIHARPHCTRYGRTVIALARR